MFKLQRKIALLLLAAGIVLPGAAADYVKLSDAQGEAVFFALDERPEVTFTSSALVITTTKQTIEYPISDYRAITFENPTSDGIVSAQYEPVFSLGESLRAEGLQPGSSVAVYDAAGQVIGSDKASAVGTVDIPLGNRSGVLVVKTTSRTFKFIKR